MTLEERSRLSFYKELAPLNAGHGVFLMQHGGSGGLFVKKTLVNYQPDIFARLKAEPVPNMPRIVEAIEDEDRLIVIESYLSGKTLQQILSEKGTLPLPEVLRIALQLCRILERLHGKGIIHRDIKPSNVILSEDGVVKLLDLDAAKVYRAEESRDTKLIGTQGYAAPEQYGFGASSPATDIYALGILLNILAAGEFPNVRKTSDPALNTVIARCTRMEPAERYTSVAELREALQVLASGSFGANRPTEAVYTQADPFAFTHTSYTQAGSSSQGQTGSNSNPAAVIPVRKTASGHTQEPTYWQTQEPTYRQTQTSGFTSGPRPTYSDNQVPWADFEPVPPYAPAPFASGAARAAKRSGAARLIPPGFRTGKVLKMLIAVIWYFMAVGVFFSILSENRFESVLENYIVGFWSLSLTFGFPFFVCNYAGIWQKLRIDRIPSVWLRYLVAAICCLIFVFLYAGILNLILLLVSK